MTSFPVGLTLHAAITAISLLIYAVTSHVQHRKRSPAAAIAWVFFILLAAYVALPAFLIFGARKRPRPQNNRAWPGDRPLPLDADGGPAFFGPSGWLSATDALGQARPAGYADFHLHPDGGAAWQALRRILQSAQHRIDISTFILNNDGIGQSILEVLEDKARQGVQVRLLVDGMGSLMGRLPDLTRLRAVGVQCLIFAPPLGSPASWTLRGRINLRNHRKMLVVDSGMPQSRVWCGGRNLAVEYFEGDARTSAWQDLSFDFSGPLVAQVQAQFDRDWAFAQSKGQFESLLSPLAEQGLQKVETPSSTDSKQAQLIVSGPDQADDTLYTLILMAIYQARQRIAILTPYFIPNEALINALCLAARRGVQVDLLVPARSNHFLSDVARARSMRDLAAAGAHIGLAPTMHHGKLMVFDDQLALAGSANFDSRSLFLNYELMIAFQSAQDVAQFVAWLDAERANAAPFVPVAPGFWRDLVEGLLLGVGFEA